MTLPTAMSNPRDWLGRALALEQGTAGFLEAWSRCTDDADLAEILEFAAARARDRVFRLRRASQERGFTDPARPPQMALPMPATDLNRLQQFLDRPRLYEETAEFDLSDPALTDLVRILRQSEAEIRRLFEEFQAQLQSSQPRRAIRVLVGGRTHQVDPAGPLWTVLGSDGGGTPCLVRVIQPPEVSLRWAAAPRPRWLLLLSGQGVYRPADGSDVSLQIGRLAEIQAEAAAEILATGDWPLSYLIIGESNAVVPWSPPMDTIEAPTPLPRQARSGASGRPSKTLIAALVVAGLALTAGIVVHQRFGVQPATRVSTSVATVGTNPTPTPVQILRTAPAQAAPSPLAPSPTLVTSLRTVLDESFAGTQRKWPHNPQATAWLGEGGYHLFAREPGQFVAIGAPLADSLADSSVTATFRKVGGPPGGGYGVIVRDQGPGPRDGINQAGRYYVLAAGDRGEVGIWRRDGDRWIDLLPWTPSEAVRPGGATNQLTVQAIGGRFTFLVNGFQVADLVVDSALGAGGVGIFVGGDFNEVVVDQFLVQVPG